MFLFFIQIGVIFANDNISDIKIINNDRIDSSIIKNYLTLKKASKYSPKEANNSIKNLYSTGLFERVDIDFNNGILTVKVVENPLITEIAFDGNKKIDDTIL